MKQKKLSAKLATVILVGLVLVGIVAIAAEYGTSADPLVSQSYIDSVFQPELLSKVDTIVNERASGLQTQIASAQDLIDRKMSEFEIRQLSAGVDSAFLQNVSDRVIATVKDQSSGSATFQTVALAKGNTFVAGAGCEIVLQEGSAACVSGLIDTTTGGALLNGKAAAQYHLYLAPAAGRGLKANAATTLLVRGSYQIK